MPDGVAQRLWMSECLFARRGRASHFPVTLTERNYPVHQDLIDRGPVGDIS
jgi:hypothetical protein